MISPVPHLDLFQNNPEKFFVALIVNIMRLQIDCLNFMAPVTGY